MEVINKITNTNPLIVHAAGFSHHTKEWKELCDKAVDTKVELANDVTIISFFFGNAKFPLKQQLENSNIEYVNASENKLIPFWQNRMKIKFIDETIKSINTKYVLILDGIDILMADNCTDIVERFKEFNCKILYNATKNCYPEHITKDIENSHTEWKYLNAGALIGETEYVAKFYNDIMIDYDNVSMPLPQSEQGRIRDKWKNYSYIKCDYGCKIFQPLLMTPYSFNENKLTVH